MNNYMLCWLDDDKRHEFRFDAESDKDAIKIGREHDIGLADCWDLIRGNDLIDSEEMMNWGKKSTEQLWGKA